MAIIYWPRELDRIEREQSGDGDGLITELHRDKPAMVRILSMAFAAWMIALLAGYGIYAGITAWL